MNRRRFLELSAVGLAGSCLPSPAFAPTQDELIKRAVGLDEDARWSVLTVCAQAVGSGELLPRERLKDALSLHYQSITAYEEARRRYPEDVLVLGIYAGAQMETARLEILMGLDARDRIRAGLSCAQAWVDLCPGDPIAKGALAYRQSQAERLLAISSEPVPDLLPEDILIRAFRVTA